MGTKRQITEYLDIDLEKELWCCNRCGRELISARENYKKGCLVYIRKDPGTIYNSPLKGPFSFAPDPGWAMLVEFYCPGCGVMVENEMLPPGHPVTYDIELDIDKLKEKYPVTGKDKKIKQAGEA
ncbi:MAG TPA: acetone carboxylase subunit gamma [Dehalococcoidales bacterium]|nr:acetone carboxylase subunit gamma [Dehalococcoidales bacterium]